VEIWPNFFIGGAGKAGTTSLYEYLKQVDKIFLPNVKEPNYFSKSIDSEILLTNPIKDKKKYLKLYENVTNEIAIGDASPTYLWDPQTPKLIHEKIPRAKFVFILRNPIERAFSHYLYLISLGSETVDFEHAIKKSLNFKHDYNGRIIELGFYGEQLKRYFHFFDEKQIKILIFEEFFKNTQFYLKEILQFLGVKYDVDKIEINLQHNPFTIPRNDFSKKLIQNNTLRKLGKNLIPRDVLPEIKKLVDKKAQKPKMLEDDRNTLKTIYLDDVQKLKTILKRKLPWDDFKNS